MKFIHPRVPISQGVGECYSQTPDALGFLFGDSGMRKKREIKVINDIVYQKCSKCGEWLESNTENFRHRKDRDTTHTICRKCEVVLTTKYYRENIEKKSEYRKEYHKNHKKEHKEWSEAYYKDYIEREGVREQRRKSTQQWQNRNVEHRKNYTKQHGKIYRANKAKFEVYAHQLTIDEDPIVDKDGYILTKCTYCGRYFSPTNVMIHNRIRALNRSSSCECRLYCSDNCKQACPVFGRQWFYKDGETTAAREVDPVFRKMVLERDEYQCQRCGKTIEEEVLHVHHIQTYEKNKMLANDMNNAMTLCKTCHLSWMHAKNGYGCTDTKCV
jgi:hypothetical protein